MASLTGRLLASAGALGWVGLFTWGLWLLPPENNMALGFACAGTMINCWGMVLMLNAVWRR